MSFFIFQLPLFYVPQIHWSTYIFRVYIYRMSLKLLPIKKKVCESCNESSIAIFLLPIHYTKGVCIVVKLTDCLEKSRLVHFLFGNFLKHFWIKCQPLHYNLHSWNFYRKRGRHKVYATVFFHMISMIKHTVLEKDWCMTLSTAV